MKIDKPRISFFNPTFDLENFSVQIEKCRKLKVEANKDPFEIAPLDPKSSLVKFHQSVLEKLQGQKTYPFFVKIFELIDDPEAFLSYLKPLETALGRKMQEEGLEISDDIIPQHILLSLESDIFFPPIPQKLDLNCKKNRILSRTIADLKSQRGQKPDDVTFLRLVDEEVANQFVRDGYLFSDKTTISAEKKHILALHNKHTHQLFFEVLNLVYDQFFKESAQFSMQDVMNDLVKNTGKQSLWNIIADNVVPTTLSQEKPLMSTSNPFHLNSMIMLFGKEFGLPNLQKCLLDSFYKDMIKIWYDYKSDPSAREGDRKDVGFAEFYHAFFLYGAQKHLTNSFRDFVPEFRGTKYEPFEQDKYGDSVAVRKKFKKDEVAGKYDSLEDYASQNYERDQAIADGLKTAGAKKLAADSAQVTKTN